MTKVAFKLIIFVIVLVSVAVAWVRVQWASGKNKREADRLTNSLKDGTYNAGSFEESLSMTIKVIPVSEDFDRTAFAGKLNKLSRRKLPGNYVVQHAQFDESTKGIIIAEGEIVDTIGAGGARAVTLKLPCWLLIDHHTDSNKILFKSTIPESNDHHELQERFAEIVMRECA